MHGNISSREGVFILPSVLSFDAWFSLPSQRSKLNENPCIGYESAWVDRWGNSLGRALLGGSGTENAKLSVPVLHRATFRRRSFAPRSFTWRIVYTEKFVDKGTTLNKESLPQERSYPQKLLHRETFMQRSLDTEKLLQTETFYIEKPHREELLHTEGFTQRNLCAEELLRTEAFTHRSF